VKIHLGVIDVPYANQSAAPGAKVRAGEQTTGDVAEWIENKYGVMQFFAESHAAEIQAAVESAIEGSLESRLMGGPEQPNVLAGACSEIESQFRRFLDAREMDGKVAGVATEAAARGVNHRMKVRRGAPRPSFIDTGLYQQSFKAWQE